MLADVQVVVEAVSRSQLALPDVAMCWLNSHTADLPVVSDPAVVQISLRSETLLSGLSPSSWADLRSRASS